MRLEKRFEAGPERIRKLLEFKNLFVIGPVGWFKAAVDTEKGKAGAFYETRRRDKIVKIIALHMGRTEIAQEVLHF
jgi:hypothetical protein